MDTQHTFAKSGVVVVVSLGVGLFYFTAPIPTQHHRLTAPQYIFNRIPLYVVLVVAHTREDDVIRDQVLDILIAMLLLPIQVSGKTNKR